MRLNNIGVLEGYQDGAIWGDLLFHFSAKGDCNVHKISALGGEPFASFTLDKVDALCPHSNAVFFGCEYYDEGDEFPLLYTNLYNTYSGCEDRREGESCIYRIWREGDEFFTRLVGLIRIGFTEDLELWKSLPDNGDKRPYGNFTLDRENSRLYAFVTRNKNATTRFFSFDMPRLCDGELDESLGINVVTLEKEDILEFFDTDFMNFMQGACFHQGKIYSVEGFTKSVTAPPALRIIDVGEKKEILCVCFEALGSDIEPEFIDFANDKCYYIDGHGNAYNIEF